MRKMLQWVGMAAVVACLWPVAVEAYQASDDIIQKEFEVNNAATVFRAGNFESLNAKLESFAEFRQTTHGGDWYLTSDYDGLARVVDEALDDHELDEIEAQAEAWVQAFPKSASAYLGYATILIQRGVREAEGGAVGQRVIAKVSKLLEEHRDIVSDNAHYHAIVVRLAIAENASLDELKPLIEAAARANPSYSAPWLLAAEHLITHSADGAADLEALARVVLESTRTIEGSAQYARIYQHALEVAYGTDLFQASKAAWFDLKAGIKVLAQRHPRSGLNMNEFALMACLAGDQDALRPLIKNIEAVGRTPPESIWGDLSFFEKCRSWAAGQATARRPLRPANPIALQLSQQRLAFDPKKRLTATYEEAVRVRLRNQLSDLVFEAGFRSLEKLSEKYRSSRSRTPSGLSMLTIFYSGFGNLYGPMIEDNYDLVDQQLKSYLETFPGSPTAIALNAELIISRAWIMRNRKDSAGNIDAFALKAGNELMEQARAFLEEHKTAGQRDPYWYIQMIGVGKALGWKAEQIYALVEEGARKHPGNFHIFFSGLGATLYAPRTGSRGVHDVIEDYAKRVVQLVPEAERATIYARLYWYAEQTQFSYSLFQYTSAEWPEMRQGFEAILEAHPGGWNENAFAYFSCLAGDAAKLRELLPVIERYGEEPPWMIWKAPELRNACVEFARSTPVEANPAPDTSPEQNPT